MQVSQLREFALGGVAACGAGLFTNPLEVVKIRMQLQGELQKKGAYTVHYRNSLHAFYTIGKTDGLLALQKGLVPALWYQFCMNGSRLGSYQVLTNLGFTKDRDGDVCWGCTVVAGALAGCVGATVGSPFFMVKIHLQARSTQGIAVGTQHAHDSMARGFSTIFKEHGVLGLFRGSSAGIARVMVGSAAQLSTFSKTKQYVVSKQLFPESSVFNSFLASVVSGLAVVTCMTPFDVASTRMYNQPVGPSGKGALYKNLPDCFAKIYQQEGLKAFYKGFGPSFFREVPQSILSLVFWDQLRIWYQKLVVNER